MTDPRHSAVGVQVAYMALVERLFEKGLLDKGDLDEIAKCLTDLSAAYEMKPSHRAAVEEFSQSFMRLRPDRRTHDGNS